MKKKTTKKQQKKQKRLKKKKKKKKRKKKKTNAHEDDGLGSGLFSLRQVNVHLVTVEVGVEGVAAALVEA